MISYNIQHYYDWNSPVVVAVVVTVVVVDDDDAVTPNDCIIISLQYST